MDNLILAQEENKKGVQLATKGNFKKAIKHFRKASKLSPALPDTYYFLGLANQNLGNFHKAIKYYKKVIILRPDLAIAHNNIGVIYLNQDELDKAEKHLKSATSIDPNHAYALTNLGNVYKLKNKEVKALRAYKKAISINPNIPQAHNNIGIIYFGKGEVEKSVKYFKKAIDVGPGYPDAYLHLAIAQKKQGYYDKAIELLNKSIEFNPNNHEAYAVLGNVYLNLGEHDKAKKYFKKSISINPKSSICYNDLGNLYRNNNQIERAIDCYKKAIIINPDLAEPYHNLGVTLGNIEQYQMGIETLKKAIEINPKYHEAYYHLGVILAEIGVMDKAEKNLNNALKYNPNFSDTYNVLANIYMKTCDWDNFEKIAKKLDRLTKSEIEKGLKISEAPHLNIVRCDDLKINLEVAKSWSKEIEDNTKNTLAPFSFSNSNKKRLRIGYLSCDFYDHATAHLILGLFKAHDRKSFEVFTYSYGKDDNSAYRKKIINDSDSFHDASNIGSIETAQKIHKDKIDILIDLKGHTKGHRLDICAFKPAPIQVTYLGFPGTTGASFFDYAIVDKIVVPKSHKKYYSENLVYMPNCYQVNDNKQTISKTNYVRSDFNLPKDVFIYSCFNHTYKVNPKTFKSWANILKSTKKSVLWLYKSNPHVVNNIKNMAKDMGINPKRIIFSTRLPKTDHLKRLTLSDLVLDTFLCNGHTTTSDALWAGVPVVTLCGKHFASRVASSILTAIDMPGLVAKTPKEYETLAIESAKNKDVLELIKNKVNENRLSTSLFDTKAFTNNLEYSYKKMWEIYEKNQKPKDIYVKGK